MDDAHDIDVGTAPSPLPPMEAELTAWRALTREEQMAHYRRALQHPDCQRISDATMTDVWAMVRRRMSAPDNG